MDQLTRLDRFISSLGQAPAGSVFNPWYELDESNDGVSNAPQIRRNQLRQYFKERLTSAQILLVAEAIGYQGGHFSGMAMTSERILLGHKIEEGIRPDHVFSNLKPRRTSASSLKSKGFSENTATIVWKTLLREGIDPYSVALWNAFPWHPYQSDGKMLSNRTPDSDELEHAKPFLKEFLSIFDKTVHVAVGNHSHAVFQQIGLSPLKVRHPSYGGAEEFSRGLLNILNGGVGMV